MCGGDGVHQWEVSKTAIITIGGASSTPTGVLLAGPLRYSPLLLLCSVQGSIARG